MDIQRRHAQQRYDELHAKAGSLIEILQEELDQGSADVNADGEQGGDYRSLEGSVASCEAKPAEARVGGVLRGGHVVEDRFCYHGPAFVSVRMREAKDLRLLEHMTDGELKEATK